MAQHGSDSSRGPLGGHRWPRMALRWDRMAPDGLNIAPRECTHDQRKISDFVSSWFVAISAVVASRNGKRLVSGELRCSMSASTFFQRGQSSHAKSYSLEGSTAAALLELCLRSVSARLAQDVSTKLFSDRHVLSAQSWCFHERFFELLSLARFLSPPPRSTHVRHARHERVRPRQPPWPFSRAVGLQAHFEALVVWPLRAWTVLMGHPQGPWIMNRQCARIASECLTLR